MTTEPGPHLYHPSTMHMGDCSVCGNTADHPNHIDPSLLRRLEETRKIADEIIGPASDEGSPMLAEIIKTLVRETIMGERKCRECGIEHIPSGLEAIEIDGQPLCWADDDLCSRCEDLLHQQTLQDAARYRYLRNRQTRAVDIAAGGLFAGRIPDSVILGGEDLDKAIDAALGADLPEIPTLEARLADCLAACVDTPILTGRDECGSFRSPLEIRLGFFHPDIANRAAELLEEAGR